MAREKEGKKERELANKTTQEIFSLFISPMYTQLKGATDVDDERETVAFSITQKILSKTLSTGQKTQNSFERENNVVVPVDCDCHHAHQRCCDIPVEKEGKQPEMNNLN